MPNIKSAKKRVLVSEQQNKINSAKKTRIKNLTKKFDAAIAAKDAVLAEALLRETVSVIDKAASDGVFHDNTASRKVATLSRKLFALKEELEKTPAKKAAAKKTVAADSAEPAVKKTTKKSESDKVFDEAVKKVAAPKKAAAKKADKEEAKPEKKTVRRTAKKAE